MIFAPARRFRLPVPVDTLLHDRLCEAVDEAEGWIWFGGCWCFIDDGGTQPDRDVWSWVLVERGSYGDA